MPFLYARRAVISTYYPKYDRQTGSFETVSSSIMNEPVLEQAQNPTGDTRAIINDEVIAFNHLNYIRVEPDPNGGCRWTSAYCLDVGGMIPRKF